MGKSNHFIGQPIYGQVIKLLDKAKILQFSQNHRGERYVKSFDAYQHLVTMLYAVIMRFDSLREITTSLLAEARKLNHLGIKTMPRRSTLADANERRSEAIFADIYRDLYTQYHNILSSDSRSGKDPNWLKRLKVLDSTTISLFSNTIFKGAGRNPKGGKKKGGIKVHTIIHANEGVADDVKFTSAATHDSFMLSPDKMLPGDILAIDRAYIDIAKFEDMTKRGVIYVTKLKSNLKYEIVNSCKYMSADGFMAYDVKEVIFSKIIKSQTDGGKTETTTIRHRARIITYPHIKRDKKGKIKSVKLISLLTNDFNMTFEDIVEIYHRRWDIELLFKQMKQNFPLKYFYGESANAIKIQIWVTLIANLLLMVLKKQIKRSWSFSGFATTLRIVFMYYIDFTSFFEAPEKDWQSILAIDSGSPPNQEAIPSLF